MTGRPIKVSQVNTYIKRILQTDPLLGNLSVIGEISNLKFHGSGHVYFSLKDADSKLNCFLAADKLRSIRYELSEGMEIIAFGYVSLYERGGSYSLNIRDIQVEGTGSLSLAFQQLKDKLEKDGLFHADHKKPIPAFPEKIAVITSETGAAIRDILKIVTDRNNYVDVLIYPVLVQGPDAAPQIAHAIEQVNLLFPEVNTIIIGRGGGSMEELWAFNEEVVARSIYGSKIPVISAVGHEIDVTISDFVADYRAETPTAAAHMAVPDTNELRRCLKELRAELDVAVEATTRSKEMKLQSLSLEVFQKELESRIVLEQMGIDNRKSENIRYMTQFIEQHEKTVNLHKVTLDSLNPKSIMKRGYGAVIDGNGHMIGSIAGLEKNDPLTIIFEDGETDCNITQVRRKTHDCQ